MVLHNWQVFFVFCRFYLRRENMKKTTSLLLVLAMVFVLSLAGCGDNSGSTGGDTAKPVEDDGETVYTFKVNTHCPETIPPGMITQEACDYATEKSGGRLKFEVYFSGNYVAYEDTFLGVSDKVVDIAMIDASSIAQSYVLNQVFSKPLKTELPPQGVMEEIYHTFLAEHGDELNAEFEPDNVIWLAAGALAGYNLHIKDKAITAPEDLKGVKLETLGDAVSYFTAIGASAVAMDPGDNYSALEKNLIDGQAVHWAIMGDFATKDFLKYHTIFGKSDIETLRTGGLYEPLNGFIMNLDSWNSLPAELQAILVEAFSYGEDRMYEYDKETIKSTWQECLDRGDTFIYIEGDDLKPWYDWMDVANAEWFDACAEAGFDNAEDLYSSLIETIESYE
jgi:TRAP-type C4-dicarboxylate transport system substrate-binding protein